MTINILAIGGSTRPGSSSEQALRVAGRGAEGAGAKVTYITGRDLMFPIYDTETPDRSDNAKKFLEAVAAADGLKKLPGCNLRPKGRFLAVAGKEICPGMPVFP
jgi:FMN reductase